MARLDPEMYRRPLAGEWIWNPLTPGIDSYFRKRLAIDSEIEDHEADIVVSSIRDVPGAVRKLNR